MKYLTEDEIRKNTFNRPLSHGWGVICQFCNEYVGGDTFGYTVKSGLGWAYPLIHTECAIQNRTIIGPLWEEALADPKNPFREQSTDIGPGFRQCDCAKQELFQYGCRGISHKPD